MDMAAHKSLEVLIHYFDQNKNPKKKKKGKSEEGPFSGRCGRHKNLSHVLYALQLTLHFSASVQKQRKPA